MKLTVIPILIGALWYSHQKNWTRGRGNNRTSRDHPNYGITEIGQNTEKGPGELKRFVVIHTPMKNHQLMQMR